MEDWLKWCLAWCCLLLTFKDGSMVTNEGEEFSLARYRSTAVYANNSVIDINLVGEGFEGAQITEGGALECHTDDTTCCRGIDNPDGPGRGEWYYPDGTVVSPPGGDTTPGFYRTRDHMVIRLNRIDAYFEALSQTGVYRCEIPGAGGVNVTRYITLSNTRVRCNDLQPDVLNGTITYTPPIEISASLRVGQRYTGTIATYSCLPGYQLVGGSSQRACGPDGTWNGTEPSCSIIIIDCGSLTDPTNGQVNTSNGTTFGSTATYTCDTGYTLSGSQSCTCGADGDWASSKPTCEVIDCGSLHHPENGQVDISNGTTFGSVATFSCNTGYVLSHQQVLVCGINGSWFPASPSCQIGMTGSQHESRQNLFALIISVPVLVLVLILFLIVFWKSKKIIKLHNPKIPRHNQDSKATDQQETCDQQSLSLTSTGPAAESSMYTPSMISCSDSSPRHSTVPEKAFTHISLSKEKEDGRTLDEKEANVHVRCNNLYTGCLWMGDSGKLEIHLQSCDYTLLPCTNECMDNDQIGKFLRKDLQDHRTKECPRRQYRCPHCEEMGEYQERTTSHPKICSKLQMLRYSNSHLPLSQKFNAPKPAVVNQALQFKTHLQFIKPVQVLQVSAKGGCYKDESIGVSVEIPPGAVPAGSLFELEIGLCMYGPFRFPDGVSPVSPILMLCLQNQEVKLQKSVKITLPHCLYYQDIDDETVCMEVIKADDSALMYGDDCCFNDIVKDTDITFSHDDDGKSFATFFLKHFCFIALKEKIKREDAVRRGYCLCPLLLKEVSSGNITLRLCITYFMAPFLEEIKNQFSVGGYELMESLIQKFPLRSKMSIGAKVTSINENGWASKLMAADINGYRMISTESIDLWLKEEDELKLEQELLMYPPNCHVVIFGHAATNSSFLNIDFQTFEENEPAENLCCFTLPLHCDVAPQKLKSEHKIEDFFHLATCLDGDVEPYLNAMGLSPPNKNDVRTAVQTHGTHTGLSKCLEFWQRKNPYEATYGALLDILLRLKKGDAAIRVHQHMNSIQTE